MKHGKFKRVLALALVLCLTLSLMTTASAARAGQSSGPSWSLSQLIQKIKDKIQSTETQPSEDTGSTSSGTMTLLEDESTVTEGTELRASTYALTNNATPYAGDTTTLKYFPVTLYNYDDRINNATHQVEVDNGLDNTWNGIYFGGNSHGANVGGADSYTYSTITWERATVNSYSIDSYTNGNYYYLYNGQYYKVTSLETSGFNSNRKWDINNGAFSYTGRTLILYYQSSGTTTTASLPYADWNKWTGNLEGNNGNRTYSGLVQNTLGNDKSISFTQLEGGIFNSDATVKDIYTNVGLPFVYDNVTKYYTFDANTFGAYFHTNSAQGTSDTPSSNSNLYYSPTPQNHNFSGQDQRTKGWFPFNDAASVTTDANGTADYFFGMNATIPFTMTANGRMNANDNDSAPIEFTFSGDDDVWVFVDGQLILDMGGVRNGMNGSINFAENTWTITEMTTLTDKPAGDVKNKAISGKIFNDGSTTGTLNQTRETFAATDSHELTIFYLERGAGSSNCQIKFNLPMKDVVSVTKRATQSISSDGTLSPLTAKEQATVDNIDFGFTLTKNDTPVANTNYNLLNANGQVISTPSTDANGHFTLRNGQTAKFIGEIVADGAEYQVVEDIPNNVVIAEDGSKLYTFCKADYTYGGFAANGYTVNNVKYSKGSEIPKTDIDITQSNSISSAAVIAKGSTEAEDSLQFICENYFDANLPNPSSRPVDDQIVIDYGLPVVIDALANDVYRGDTIELTDVTGAKYGTATIENGKITYQLTKQLTGVEVLTYTAKVTGSGNSGNETTSASDVQTAKVYIIPATSMYYEENFSDLVTFTGSWSNVGTAQTDPQEPGVVGTVGDSPYGSDAAYRNDSGDSNGSYQYANTTDSAARFSYTFTGTGTSFFARTGSDSAYMRVVVKDSSENTVSDTRRNNIYKAVDGTDVDTLYNVPVFTIDELEYGTYTVTVTLMKANATISRGPTFYLDGIRVINPLNSADANASVANAAYATDGEANMTVVTLRQKLIGEAQINEDDTISWNEGDNFVLFTDTNGEITSAEEYKSNGPKEEVYLNKADGEDGQSVTFSLAGWDANTNKIYLGIKAPMGSGTVSINGNTLNINNATDCYYDISSYATITTDADGVKTATFEIKATSSLISVTNIKVTGNAEFTIVEGKNVDASGDESTTEEGE